jgi:phosphoserine phosphatase RsbU/P
VPADNATEPAEDELGRIQAVTDATLAHLDVDALLPEVLDRIVDLLQVDTAAVLLLDEASRELVATAARGLEEEVRQGVRVPVGAGFAGRIAAQKQPVVLDQVDPTTVWNPILWEKGIQSMLGVPMMVASKVVGVLHVGSHVRREFGKEDIRLLQLAAERVALATQSRLGEAHRVAARTLQRSLLPDDLPAHPHLEFAARYIPAEHGVGGDWYDVFVLPSGEVWAVSGDVAGHGLRAAVVMGRLRNAIRAYALEGAPPESVLSLADRNLQYFEPQEMATVMCAVFEPLFESVRMSSAGHPKPILVAPGQAAEYVDLPITPPVGVAPEIERSSTKVPMAPGTVLLFYTDGLVERRNEDLDVGLERLRTALTADRPDTVCHQATATIIGPSQPDDDIALLAVRRTVAS